MIRRHAQKCDEFNIAKRMIRTNEDIIGEQWVRNDDGTLAIGMKIRK